jgi:hypothetical protein
VRGAAAGGCLLCLTNKRNEGVCGWFKAAIATPMMATVRSTAHAVADCQGGSRPRGLSQLVDQRPETKAPLPRPWHRSPWNPRWSPRPAGCWRGGWVGRLGRGASAGKKRLHAPSIALDRTTGRSTNCRLGRPLAGAPIRSHNRTRVRAPPYLGIGPGQPGPDV